MTVNGQLSELIKPKTKDQASYTVYSHATYFPNHVQIYIPDKPYEKLFDGYEPTIKQIKKNSSTNQTSEDDLERSLRRTKKTIRDYVLCNCFELFATFTFKDDRQNVNHSKAKMNGWLKNEKKRRGKFEYLIVPEFHKDRQSLHFHALMKNYAGKLVEATNPKTDKPLKQSGKQIYTFESYKLGYSNVKKIDNTPESHAKVGSYIRKYITKDMPLFFGKNRYWASFGLKKPRVEDNPKPWYKKLKPMSMYATPNGLLLKYGYPEGMQQNG